MSKKLFSKVFILLLVVGLLFAVAPTGQALAQTVSTWDGTYPTEKPADMPAVSGGVQVVNTAAQFAWLASQTDMFPAGVTTVKLMVDIDLDNHLWTPSGGLGGGSAATGNIFDGNGHTISNLNAGQITIGASKFSALFAGSNTAGPIIQNLLIDGATAEATDAYSYAAVVVAASDFAGDFINITVKDAVVKATKYAGGISTYSSSYDGGANFTNCAVEDLTIEVQEMLAGTAVEKPHVGGILGYMNEGKFSGNTVKDLTITVHPVAGQPVATERVGVLIGTAQANVLVGTYDISNVTYNTAPYTKIIGLDVRTYKVVNTTQMLGYTTIQAAIDAAANGDTIQVAAGTYVEDVDVTKAVTLLGPNAGIPGNGTRVAEAIIQGTSASWVSLYVEPDTLGVTIDGFTFDGANLTPDGYSVGVEGDASDFTVRNNVFVNHSDIAIMTSGVYYDGSTWKYDKWLTDVLIKDNLIVNDVASLSGYNFGIYFQSSLGSVTGNVVTNYRSGIQVQPYWNTPSGGTIEGNTFNVYKLGIYFNYTQNSTADWLFKDNIISGLPLPAGQADTPWQGIRVETFSAGNVSFEENQVDFGTASSTQKYVYFENNVTGGTSSATPNWWGSAAGPEAGAFVGTAEYIPWCGEPECTTLVYPEFNGAVSGVFTTSETGAVSGTLTGDYTLTISGQVTGYVNNRATFTGTVTGDIVGDITATINDNGVDTLAGTFTNTGAILPVRILGIFPKSGTAGEFTGQIITGVVPPLATSMSITPSDVSTVYAGGTLQLGVVIDPETAAYGEWSIWEPAGTNTGSTISSTGLLTAGTPGTITVIVKALDGSLLDATKVITIEPALVTIAPVDPVVCGVTPTTTIDINVAGIPASTPLQGYSFRLHFDPAKTSVANLGTDIVNGDFVNDGGFLVTRWLNEDGTASPTPTGILEVAYTQFLPSTSIGAGKLASITLTHLGVAGDIPLLLSDVLLSSRDGIVIPSAASATATTLILQPAVLNTTKGLGYCDLASAVAGAAASGDVLQLQADITIPTTVTVDKALTLDLNGKVASYPQTDNSFVLRVDGASASLTINDTSDPDTGAIRAIDVDNAWEGRGINVLNGGSLIVNGGSIQGEYASVYVRAGSSMVLNGGTIGGVNGTTEYSGIVILGNGTPGSAALTVNGGVIDSYDFAISGNGTAGYTGTSIQINAGTITADATALYLPQDGVVNIAGGTITAPTAIEVKSGDLNVSGGTITGTGPYVATPSLVAGYSTDTGDAIFITSQTGYAGGINVNITGGTIQSTNSWAMREYYLSTQDYKVDNIFVSNGTFIGGTGAVTFSSQLASGGLTDLALTGGLYNTDPAYPDVFVFVPYGTVYNTTVSMYEIVGISLNVHDFYYNNSGTLRGVSTDFTVTNFLISEASSVTVNLYSGVEGAYVLQQTNVLKTPTSWNVATLTSSFDYFGTYVSNSWTNSDAAGFDPTLAPTRVEVIIVLPGGTLTGFNNLPTGDRTTILPSVSGLVTLQGILAPRAGVPIYLTSGLLVRDTTSTAMTDINYWFTGVETLTYTFTTSQARYLNVTTASSKIFLVDRDLNLTDLRLYGGDVDQNNEIQVNDASLVGQNWGSTTDPEANINYDGIVNIQDLALVGGNFGMTSATAYNWWSPLP